MVLDFFLCCCCHTAMAGIDQPRRHQRARRSVISATVSIEGGYSTCQISRSRGEVPTRTRLNQPPGTPSAGLAYVRCCELRAILLPGGAAKPPCAGATQIVRLGCRLEFAPEDRKYDAA